MTIDLPAALQGIFFTHRCENSRIWALSTPHERTSMTRAGKIRLGIATGGMFVFPILFATYTSLSLFLVFEHQDFRLLRSGSMTAVLALALIHVIGGLSLLLFYIRHVKTNPSLSRGQQRRWVWLFLLSQGFAVPFYYAKQILPLEDDE